MDTLFQTINSFLRKNHVLYNETTLKAELLTHPEYPSLSSIVDTLTLLGIESVCVSLTLDELTQNGAFALVYLTGDINEFAIVRKINEREVEVSGPFSTQKVKYTRFEFQQLWEGVALYVVEDEHFLPSLAEKCKHYFRLYKTETFFICLLALFIGLLRLSSYSQPIFFYYLIGIKIAGLFISIGLIKQELHQETKTLKKLCSVGKSFSCTAVLASKASKLFGWIPLADIGGAYFSGGIILLLIGLINKIYLIPIIDSLIIFSYLSILYIGYSLYYQYFVIKKWCPLCLLILLMLTLEISGSLYFYKKIEVSFQILIFVSILFGLLWLIWDTLHNWLEKNKKLSDKEIEYLKLLKNKELFEGIKNGTKKIEIKSLPIYTYIPPLLTSSTRIIAIISLSCSPCAHVCQILLSLKRKYKEKLDIYFCFITNTADPQNIMNSITVYFYALYIKKGFNEVAKALQIWMTNTNFEHLKAVCPVDFEEKEMQFIFLEQINWLEKHSIHVTPTIIVNDHLLPELYSVDQLPYIVK